MSGIEVWKPVIGAERLYEVSSFGHVRSCTRTSLGRTKNGKPCARTFQGRVLRPRYVGKDYVAVSLSLQGTVEQRYVHELVARAFIGPRPIGMEIAHHDGIKSNNASDNLRYDTPAGNAADKKLHNTDSQGERNPMAVLTAAEVIEIRRLSGVPALSQRKIAEQFGVSQGCISDIKRGKNWGHLRP
jgi:hypothetical protein